MVLVTAVARIVYLTHKVLMQLSVALGLHFGYGSQLNTSCRRNVTADAIGMAKVRGRREGERNVNGARIRLGTRVVRDTTMYLGSGLSVEITPLLLLVSTISMLSGTTITAA